jgi:hypothetical protein
MYEFSEELSIPSDHVVIVAKKDLFAQKRSLPAKKISSG